MGRMVDAEMLGSGLSPCYRYDEKDSAEKNIAHVFKNSTLQTDNGGRAGEWILRCQEEHISNILAW